MESRSLTIGDELDRLEVLAGKIGMNTRAQAYTLLKGLDEVYRGMQDISNEQSHKVAEAQFGGIVAKMEREARLMIRDMGGTLALSQARAQVNPPGEHAWWYLDDYLERKQKDATRHMLVIGGIILAVLAVVGVIYKAFLAPDPEVVARYSFQQNAQDMLMSGDFNAALQAADQGLAISPQDPTLLILKGVAQEFLGQSSQAQESYQLAMQRSESPEAFYVTRAQLYASANQPEKALEDAQEANRLNPDLPEGYLIAGQAHELLGKYEDALADYDKAYNAADASGKYELAAMARMRTAMLMQSISAMAVPGELDATATP